MPAAIESGTVAAGLVPADPEMPTVIESGTVAADLVPADPEIPAIIESGTVAAGLVPADPEMPTIAEPNSCSSRFARFVDRRYSAARVWDFCHMLKGTTFQGDRR